MHSWVVFKMKGGAPDFLATFMQAASEQYTANLPQDPLSPASLELRPSRQQPAMVKIHNKGPFLKKHGEKVKSHAKFLKKHGEKPNNMSRDDKTMSDLMKRLRIDQADVVFLFSNTGSSIQGSNKLPFFVQEDK